MRKALEIALISEPSVVVVGRGSTQGFAVSEENGLLVEGSNLPGAKTRFLLFACLLRQRFGFAGQALGAPHRSGVGAGKSLRVLAPGIFDTR